VTPLARCPVCDGPVWYDTTGAVSCIRKGRAHFHIPRAHQRVQAGETLADVIAGAVAE
jgi:hypothetical protein